MLLQKAEKILEIIENINNYNKSSIGVAMLLSLFGKEFLLFTLIRS